MPWLKKLKIKQTDRHTYKQTKKKTTVNLTQHIKRKTKQNEQK